MNRLSLGLMALVAMGCASAKAVTVVTTPPGAHVYVDGALIGNSPATFTDESSDGHYYKIDLTLPGYKPKNVVIKQEEAKDSLVCIGLASACCPLVRIALLKSYALPKPSYEWELEALNAQPYGVVPVNSAPPLAPPPPAILPPTAPPPAILQSGPVN